MQNSAHSFSQTTRGNRIRFAGATTTTRVHLTLFAQPEIGPRKSTSHALEKYVVGLKETNTIDFSLSRVLYFTHSSGRNCLPAYNNYPPIKCSTSFKVYSKVHILTKNSLVLHKIIRPNSWLTLSVMNFCHLARVYWGQVLHAGLFIYIWSVNFY